MLLYYLFYPNLISRSTDFLSLLIYFIFISREKALKILIALATGVSPECSSINLTEEALLVFSNVTESILDDEKQFAYYNIQYNYLPQFLIEWVSCHAWFLYLTRDVKTTVSMLKDVIEKIQNIIKLNSYQENQ